MRFLGTFFGTLVVFLLAAATYAPKGVTHHNLIGVTESLSPTSDPNDRALIEFVDKNGNTQIVTWRWTSRAIAVVDPNGRDPNGTSL